MLNSKLSEILMPIFSSSLFGSQLEDMKQRLRFLRRRHTDSSIESSVRPSKVEAEKWANSFVELMGSRYGKSLFHAFLLSEFGEENLEFWMACEEFKKSRPSKMAQKASKIFNDFLAVKAQKEVNLDPTLRNTIMQSLSNPDRNMFDIAQRRIQSLIESGAYLRFLESSVYTDMIAEERHEPQSPPKPVPKREDS